MFTRNTSSLVRYRTNASLAKPLKSATGGYDAGAYWQYLHLQANHWPEGKLVKSGYTERAKKFQRARFRRVCDF